MKKFIVQSAKKNSKKVIENCKKMREKKNTTTNL
jgi:hypothetical protein